MEQVSYIYEEGENALVLQRNSSPPNRILSSNKTGVMNHQSVGSSIESLVVLEKQQSKIL